MFPSISLGPYLLQTPGLMLMIGVWVGTFIAEKEANKISFSRDAVSNLIFYSLIAGLAGARLAFALRTPGVYLSAPLSLLALDATTLAPLEGLLTGLVVGVIIIQQKDLPVRKTLDALAPGMAVFMIAWAASNILSGDAFGSPTDLPWAIHLWGESRHPVQIYDLILSGSIFIVISRGYFKDLGSGVNFLALIFLSALARLITEAFRGDSIIWLGSARSAQVVSLGLMIGSLWLIGEWTRMEKSEPSSPDTA
jgi:phosphatidylglycerol:prolipoprotein diacylglycerol transferase